MMYPYLSGINYESIADGIGVRVALFLSGCSHNCEGCFSPKTHNPYYGQQITPEAICDIAKYIQKNSYINGITFTGGDPMYNPETTANLLISLRGQLGERWKDLNVWLYTGYRWEQLMELRKINPYVDRILELTDIVVDGKFVQAFADASLMFRGSSNQRMIDVRQSMKNGLPCIWNAIS